MKSTKRVCACKGGTLTRFIQPVILTILSEQDDHGYSILSKLAGTYLWKDKKPDASGLYRTLKNMEQQGLIVSHIDIADNENMGKRVFSITPAGLECMMHWKETLEDYQKGIDEIIEGIAEAAGKRKLD